MPAKTHRYRGFQKQMSLQLLAGLITGVSHKTLKNALANKNGMLNGFRFERIPSVEHPYDPKKHKPKDCQPALRQRQGGPMPVRQHLPNGGVIDWEGVVQFCKIAGVAHETFKDALDNKNGMLNGFRLEKIPSVEHPYDPKKHKPEDYRKPKRRPDSPRNEPIITLAARHVTASAPEKKDMLSEKIDAVLKSTKTLLDSMGRV